MVEKLVIIGSGPAAYTAAIYTGRALLEPLLIAGNLLGGQASLTAEIENYPGFPHGIGGSELMQLMLEQAERFGARVQLDEVTGVDFSRHPFVVVTPSAPIEALAVIIATGTTPRRLGVPGESEFAGRGVSFCATCDGFFYRGKEVIVVGGGNAAVVEADFLTRFASRIYLVHRRDELRAEKVLQERVLHNPKIAPVWNSVVMEILGKENVTGVRLRNVRSGEESVMPVAGVFIYIGTVPNTGFLQGQVPLDAQGYIEADRQGQTAIPGVFAAGDVQNPLLHQVATAVGSGATAGMTAERFLAELAARGYAELRLRVRRPTIVEPGAPA
ncbi:MAG: thioredoxin-disulfide reductase [Anaerolineae bacterium]|nr:thioredoxin-disulfide reductase [Anaerolineae bacterium]